MLQWNVSLFYQTFSGLIFLLHSCVCVIFLLQMFQTSELIWPLTASPHHDSSAPSPHWSCVWKWLPSSQWLFVRYIEVIYTKWKTSGLLCGRESVCSAAQTLSSSFWKPLSRFRMLCNTSRIWGWIWTYVILRGINFYFTMLLSIFVHYSHPPVAFLVCSRSHFLVACFPPGGCGVFNSSSNWSGL